MAAELLPRTKAEILPENTDYHSVAVDRIESIIQAGMQPSIIYAQVHGRLN
jgi:hypothetical protein